MISLLETPTRLIVTGEEDEMKLLRQELRYHPKGYFHADSYQLFKLTGGESGWDGYQYPLKLCTTGGGEVLRGYKDKVLAICTAKGLRCDTKRCLESPFPKVRIGDLSDDLIQSSFKLDANQKQAVVEWLRYGIGIANMAVNAGKTATFALAAAFIKRAYPEARFLYFTPTERLVKQVSEGMQNFLPDWNITQYGGGKKDNTGADMVIATQAMLSRNFKQLVKEKWFLSFHALLLDESHHCQSPTAKNVLLSCGAYFRMAASDSLKEDDLEKFNLIQGLCGPVRWTVTSSTLIEQGRSAAPHLYLVDVPEWKNRYKDAPHVADPRTNAWFLQGTEWKKALYLSPVYELDEQGKIKTKTRKVLVEDRWEKEEVPIIVPTVHRLLMDGQEVEAPARFTLLDRRYERAIIRFKERNALIAQWAKYYSDKGWPTVVVATRTTHVIILETILGELLGDKVRSLHGEAPLKERNDTFEWIKKTPGGVLITPLIKEGVSINELRAGVVADPVADFEVAKQIIGRFMRKKEDNHCYITWFIDRQHPKYLANVRNMFDHLEQIEGFTFYHPVIGPDTIWQAQVHHGKAYE